ncbi:MAG TPA: DUF1844 domain-containing protein [Nitrospiria bacterium]|jgi:hypothetical protein
MSDEEKSFTVRDRRFKDEGKDHEKVEPPRSKEEPNRSPTEKSSEQYGPVEINFSTFLFSLASSVFIALGEEPNPITREKSINLSQAQETIDLLSILQEKTRGNLTQEEEGLLSNLLYSVRIKYVEMARKKDQSKG